MSQGSGRYYKRWILDSIAEVHFARFLLRPSALELFQHDRSTALVNFPDAQVALSSFPQLQACLAAHLSDASLELQ